MATDMNGKVVLITGANSGIGRETSLGLAKMGASVVMACRDPVKAARAKEYVVGRSGSGSVEITIADLLKQGEVRRLAADFLESHERLDVLVNNAGLVFTRYSETGDGIESTMAVNYFAPFLLTNLLADRLKLSAPSRVVNVASTAHFDSELDLQDLNGKGKLGLGGFGAYGRSKLALVMFTYELARRLQGSGVTANCLHPGVVRSHFWAHTGYVSPIVGAFSVFMISAKKGARTSIYLASSPEVEGVTGKYFDKRKSVSSDPKSYDEAAASRLWELSLKTTGLMAESEPPDVALPG